MISCSGVDDGPLKHYFATKLEKADFLPLTVNLYVAARRGVDRCRSNTGKNLKRQW
jgi:hypothetical protein